MKVLQLASGVGRFDPMCWPAVPWLSAQCPLARIRVGPVSSTWFDSIDLISSR